jgi:hypothetical protein
MDRGHSFYRGSVDPWLQGCSFEGIQLLFGSVDSPIGQLHVGPVLSSAKKQKMTHSYDLNHRSQPWRNKVKS